MRKEGFALLVGLLTAAVCLTPATSFAQQTGRSQRIFGNPQGTQPTTQPMTPGNKGLQMKGDILSLRNPRPGGLKELITPEIKKRVRKLIIEGAINRDDASVIKSICNRSTCVDDRGKTIDNYLDLDLLRASIESSYANNRDETCPDMFASTYHLRSIRLPMRLRGLGRNTFYNSRQLDWVEMPRGVKYFGEAAFKNCPKLEELSLPSELEEIGDQCFYDCTGLKEIAIPSSVVAIGKEAFYNCPLTRLQLPEGLQSLGQRSISGTKLQTIHIPHNTHIENDAIGICSHLRVITVDQGNQEYASLDGVLFNRSQTVLIQMPPYRQGEYVVPGNVGSIKAYAFQNSHLSRIVIPPTVKTISEGAFYNCKELQSMQLPNSIQAISASTFQGCSGMQSVQIPGHVISIGNKAFSGCTALSAIDLPSQLKILGTEAFRSCHSIARIQVPEQIATLPKQCFIDCQGLMTVALPTRLQAIEEEAFKGCVSLTSLQLPTSLLSIGNEAFRSCNSLQEIVIPPSVQKIGKKPFTKCEQLRRIVCTSPTPPELKSNGSEKVVLVVPAGKAAIYKKASQWKKFKNIIEIQPTF